MADTVLAEGTYVMCCLADDSLALDCASASDASGANVRLWTRNDTDAQLVHVCSVGGGACNLVFAASGKCLDVADGALMTQGANVQQWDGNGTDAQRFTVKAASGYTKGGMQGYKVYASATIGASDGDRLVEADGVGAPYSGQNLCLSRDEGTSPDQIWLFYPMNPVPIGTYVLRSVLDASLVVDIEGSSHSAGARAFIAADHAGTGVDYGNNQIFFLREYTSTGQAKLWATHSWQVLEIADTVSEAHQGSVVVQSYDEGTSTDQFWVIVPSGTATLNGVTVPAYEVRNVAAAYVSSLCLDVTDGKGSPGTYLQLWERNGTDAQRWIFEPAEMTDAMAAVPSIRGLAPVVSGTPQLSQTSTRHAMQTVPTRWVPSWSCTARQYQVRVRYRSRKPGGAKGSWSPWRTPQGSQAHDGWGYIFEPDCSFAADSSAVRYGPEIVLPAVDNISCDHLDVEMEARAFAAVQPAGVSGAVIYAHGPSASSVCEIAYKPKLQVTAVGWSPDGLIVSYTSDWHVSGVTVAIDRAVSVDKFGRREDIVPSHPRGSSGIAYDGQPASGTITVPLDRLSSIPADGTTIEVSLYMSQGIVSAYASAALPMKWDQSHGLRIIPAYMPTDRDTMLVTIPRQGDDEVWMMTKDGLEKCSETESIRGAGWRTYELLPPLCTPYSICMVTRKGDLWGTNVDRMPAMDDAAFVWNWESAEDGKRAAIVHLGNGDGPSSYDSESPQYERHITAGRSYPVYTFGATEVRDLTVTGTILIGDTHPWSTEEAMQELKSAHHAVFRDPMGGRHHVAILGLEMPKDSPRRIDVTVKQEEESA